MIKTNELEKFEITFKTLSPVSISPRESYCFYKEIDYGDEVSEANIIYPFYQYGEYEEFDLNAQYYIPGSALKGALLSGFTEQEKKEFNKMYVDDIGVDYEDLVLTTPCKLQYIRNLDDLDSNKKPTFSEFFPNVEVQMLKGDRTFKATIYAKDEDTLESLQRKVPKLTQEKLKAAKKVICQLIGKIDSRIGKEEIGSTECQKWTFSKKELETFRDKLLQYENKNIIFLGGYKGEVLSKVLPKSNANDKEINSYQGTFYRDEELGLPFGLVKILPIEGTQS